LELETWRSISIPFAEAWDVAVEDVLAGLNRVNRHAWLSAFSETRDAWRAAYYRLRDASCEALVTLGEPTEEHAPRFERPGVLLTK
jgi:hypothetical protein